jgi:hypothetical protein
MTSPISSAPSDEADRVIAAVLHDLRHGSSLGVVVDSPPGAGKSTLVVRAALTLAAEGSPVMIVAQTNEQVDDLVHRLAVASPSSIIGRLSAADYVPSSRVSQHAAVLVRTSVSDLASVAVVVGTAAKWTFVNEGEWQWAIVDEAYQMRSDMLLRIAPRFARALFVGDPGQLDPFSTIDIERWTGLTWDPMQSAVAVLLRHNPTIVPHQLPVSWRLPATAAPVVSEAFYPFTPFSSGTTLDERRLSFRTAAIGGGVVDRVLATAAETGWALHELPARHALRTDSEAAAACADVALRLLERGAVAYSTDRSPSGEPVTPDRIAIGTAHRDQAAAIRSSLGNRGAGITVDTANRLQGREYDVTIVLHPLSGRRDATAFHLESGRLCVLTSRHRHACIVIARAGIQELLDAHPSTEPVHLNVPVKFPDGWEANQSILTRLSKHRVSGT